MPSFAMKVLDLQWFTTFGMSPDEAASRLAADGIDTVLTQNRIDPLPNSGVDQDAYLAAAGENAAAYSDRAWAAALKRHGLQVVQTSAMLFDPSALNRFPDARPVNAAGEPDHGVDWYIGVCPTHEGHLAEKLAKLRRVTEELEPDGLFLQFMRYPGFWENWTWSPDYEFTNRDRFCFCDRCRTLFAADLGLSLPDEDTAGQAAFILDRYEAEWHAWRCRRVVEIIARTAAETAVIRPGLEITLNTLPFPAADFDGSDVRRTITAQDLTGLSLVVQRFELMTYLQILNRPTAWVRDAVADARSRVRPGREVVCTLQVDSLYTAGIHAGRNRVVEVTADEIEAAGSSALEAGADGLVFYHWTDFLTDDAAGGRKCTALRALTGAARA
jgi:hypothetical protein